MSLKKVLEGLETTDPSLMVILRLCKAIRRARIGVGIAHRRLAPFDPVHTLLKTVEKDLEDILGEDRNDKHLDPKAVTWKG